MISQSEILSCINNYLDYLRKDFSHAAIVGVLKFSEIQTKLYTKELVDDEPFDHIFSSIPNDLSIPDDFYSGIILIPISMERNFKQENLYFMCEVF